MNPSSEGGTAAVDVAAYFLVGDAEFLTKTDPAMFTVAAGEDGTACLKESCKRLEIVSLSPGGEPYERKITVPKEVTHVGLVARFQDLDRDQAWCLSVPILADQVVFTVEGRRLIDLRSRPKAR